MNKPINETGNVYGALTVLKQGPKSHAGKLTWSCRCICGVETKPIVGSDLRQSKVKSCGCLMREFVSIGNSKPAEMTTHPAYRVYHAAKGRCNNKLDKSYFDYGGRGVQFKFTSFEEFWAVMGSTYEPGLTLDRENNEGHYEPGNVRWATWLEQARNKRNNVWLEYNGRRQIQNAWAREFGVDSSFISKELKTNSVEELFSKLENK